LTGFIIALGITFVFTVRGFINGLQREITENMTKGITGEIQISHIGAREALPAKAINFMFEYSPDLREILTREPHVTGVAPRLQFPGMVNHQLSQTTTPFLAIAVDPEAEKIVSPRLATMVRDGNGGKFLDQALESSAEIVKQDPGDIDFASMDAPIDFDQPVAVDEAKNLKTKGREFHQVLVGPYMQEGFISFNESGEKVRSGQIGDELVLLAVDPDGGQHSMPATLTGVMESTNPAADKTILYLPISAAREMLDIGESVSMLILSLDDTETRFDVAQSLTKKLAPYHLEAYPWDEVQKFFVNIMDLQNAFFGIIMVIIMLFVVVAIVITTLMTVSERIREIGTLMAIGYRRKHIMQLFLLESTMISMAGTVVGMLMGSLVIAILNQVGLNFTIPGTNSIVEIHPFQTAGFFIVTAFVGFVAGIMGALYPAYNASRQSPLEAMVHI